MYYFCTYFDHHYLSRGLALYRSLKDHCSSFRLWVLCMDRPCFEALSTLELKEVHPIALQDFEEGDRELLTAKMNRSQIEYYFTCTPSLPLFILRNHPEINVITYLDADLFFFADPAPLLNEMGDQSIAIIEHRFSPPIRESVRYGIYNVGWVSFRHDDHALACLHWWRDRCIEWCYDRLEGERFADQKYLDEWPGRFHGVVVLQHKGANLAPWNLDRYTVHAEQERIWVDGQPLIFFHFHGFKQIKRWLFDPNLVLYRVRRFKLPLRSIYGPYIRVLSETTEWVSSLPGGLPIGRDIRSSEHRAPSLATVSARNSTARNLKRRFDLCRSILTRRYIMVLNGHIL